MIALVNEKKVESFSALGATELKPRADAITFARVFLGCSNIASAFRSGAKIVFSGKVGQSALVLGALVSKFNWSMSNYELLAKGAIVGHILEQGSGQISEFMQTRFLKRSIFVAECFSSGNAIFSKFGDGIVTVSSMIETLFSGVVNPQSHHFPDVTVDLSSVFFEAVGVNRVRVDGATGYCPSSFYQASLNRDRGYALVGLLFIYGVDCQRKAAAIGRSVLENANIALTTHRFEPIMEYAIDVLGNGNECCLRVGVVHARVDALDAAMLEIRNALISTAPVVVLGSITGPFPYGLVQRVFIKKTWLDTNENDVGSCSQSLQKPYQSNTVITPVHFGTEIVVPLSVIAYGRSSSVGNGVTIVIIARSKELFAVLLREATLEKIQEHLHGHGHLHENGERHSHLRSIDHGHGDLQQRCQRQEAFRFEVPGLSLVNVVLTDVLGPICIDLEGKTFAQRIFSMKIRVPKEMIPKEESKL